MTTPSGRFSRFPAVDRSVPAVSAEPNDLDLATAIEAQRLADLISSLPPVEPQPVPEPEPVPEPQSEPQVEGAVEDWPSPDVVASWKVVEILEWAGSDRERRAYAYNAESANRKRTTALEGLQPPLEENVSSN